MNWKTVDWKKVYSRSRRPIELRKFSSPFLAIRVVGLLFLLFWAWVLPGTQISWDWITILIFLAAVIWLGWVLWPVLAYLENWWASKFVIKARVARKLEARFWQTDTRPIAIVIEKAFRITPNGDLIEARSWLGHRRLNIPDWLYSIVKEQEAIDLLCLSTRRILGKLEQFSNP
jgi:hypothetical protein